MKLEIESKRENALQERSEIMFTVEHAGEPTPKRDEMRSALAVKTNVPKERVIIDHEKSEIAKKMGLNVNGKFALKVR